ncbi:MAG: dihydrofolate reductase family protein [Saprospiraceae bacterium]
MKKIIVLSFVTLDGVVQAPGGPTEDPSNNFQYGGWTVPFFDETSGKFMSEQMSKPADLLLGRRTFEIFASYWPENENEWPGINTMKKYVASNSMKNHTWNNTIILDGNVVAKLKKIKNETGPDLQVHGSSNFIQTLLKNDLVDELWLKIFPITLGTGKRLFGSGTIPKAFNLVDVKTTPSGVVFANYKKLGDVKTGSFGS